MSGTGTESVQPATEEKPVTPPDAEVQQRIKDAEKAAKTAGLAALAEKQGFADVAALEKFIETQKQAEKDRLSEVDRKAQEAEEKEQAATKATAEAERKSEDADILVALIEAGAPRDSARKLIPNVRMEIGETKIDDKVIEKALKELQKTFPTLFNSTQSPPPGGSNPGSPPPGAKGEGGQAKSKAQELVVLRHPNVKAKT